MCIIEKHLFGIGYDIIFPDSLTISVIGIVIVTVDLYLGRGNRKGREVVTCQAFHLHFYKNNCFAGQCN